MTTIGEQKNCSVIIIGAGASGIAAAKRLLENGIEDIIILEAENRIGGRISSIKFGDAYVEAGAEFCHGEENNVVHELTEKFNILKHSKDDIKMFCSNGEEVNKELAEEIYGFVDFYEQLERKGCSQCTTIGSFVSDRYRALLVEKYKNDRKKQRICEDAMSSVRNVICIIEGSFCWYQPTLNCDYRRCAGDSEMNWDGKGYKTIIDIMMEKYPNEKNHSVIEDKIILSKLVTKIIWDDNDGKVEVKCSDGSSYSGDHVILTASIGVLKEKLNTLFNPHLPIRKKQCIKCIGYDAIMKVHLHFPEKWWPEDFVNHLLVWQEEDKQNSIVEFPFGPNQDGRSWLTDVCHISPVANNPNVLLIWIAGDHVPELENTSSKIITDGIMYVLTKFLGSYYEIRQPDSMLHSCWYSNPNFRGAYSYETIESRGLGYNCLEELGKPLYNSDGKPALLLAGEATSVNHYSTVHGAIESGYRAAKIILEHHRELDC